MDTQGECADNTQGLWQEHEPRPSPDVLTTVPPCRLAIEPSTPGKLLGYEILMFN